MPKTTKLLGLAAVGVSLSLAVATAKAEEESNKVLTVGALGGPEATVGDKVAAPLEGKVKFLKANGEVLCAKSEISGEVKSNPVVGAGNAEIKIETFTFKECSSTVGGAGGTATVKIETLPLLAETEGSRFKKITDNGLVMGVEIVSEPPGKEAIACIYRAKPLTASYNNSNGLFEISEIIGENGGTVDVKNCCPPVYPNWEVKYKPLKDETKAGRIFIN